LLSFIYCLGINNIEIFKDKYMTPTWLIYNLRRLLLGNRAQETRANNWVLHFGGVILVNTNIPEHILVNVK
jgi:hypothetical protein